nr:Hypothetical protein [Providencia alcalifaciens]
MLGVATAPGVHCQFLGKAILLLCVINKNKNQDGIKTVIE